MANNLLDLSSLLEISQSLAGQATVDLQTVDKGGDSDETVGLDILVELLGGRLLKDDGVLGLVLNWLKLAIHPSNRIPRSSHVQHSASHDLLFFLSFFSSSDFNQRNIDDGHGRDGAR